MILNPILYSKVIYFNKDFLESLDLIKKIRVIYMGKVLKDD